LKKSKEKQNKNGNHNALKSRKRGGWDFEGKILKIRKVDPERKGIHNPR
jgi:hypothetical protein